MLNNTINGKNMQLYSQKNVMKMRWLINNKNNLFNNFKIIKKEGGEDGKCKKALLLLKTSEFSSQIFK